MQNTSVCVRDVCVRTMSMRLGLRTIVYIGEVRVCFVCIYIVGKRIWLARRVREACVPKIGILCYVIISSLSNVYFAAYQYVYFVAYPILCLFCGLYHVYTSRRW